MITRADRIFEILSKDGRQKVSEVRDKLAILEKIDELHVSIISTTARQDNRVRRESGKTVRFNLYNDGNEDYGYISINKETSAATSVKLILENYIDQIPLLVEKSNNKVRKELKNQISNLSWQAFESNFLARILEALGFSEVELTQQTRDGGLDAFCSYKRGIVKSEAIVSAKHWKSASVPESEIDRLRGIPHQADTAIIVTSSKFTGPAKDKAKPAPGWRSVVLIDGDLIVDTCLKNAIGVDKVELPILYKNKNLSSEKDKIE
jgi:restriction endonuclease Mrr